MFLPLIAVLARLENPAA
jgi:hypothetical protein